jgi:hypothetical protein
MSSNRFDFQLKAYETAILTYNSISDRVSLRFNILLTGDIALAGFFIDVWVKDKFQKGNGSVLFIIIGIVLSIFLYFQSAQDKYILKHQIMRINQIKEIIKAEQNLLNFPCLFDPLDKTDTDNSGIEPKEGFIFESFICWRSNILSITKIPAILSILFFFFWLFVFVINIKQLI